MNKIKLLKFSLLVGALFYLIGGVVHFFGLTLFPWYVASLYSPYHDTVIALTSLVLAFILYTLSKNPIKNIDILNTIIISGFLAVIFSFYIIRKIDFNGADEIKRIETIVEVVLLIVYLGILIYLKPKSIKSKKVSS